MGAGCGRGRGKVPPARSIKAQCSLAAQATPPLLLVATKSILCSSASHSNDPAPQCRNRPKDQGWAQLGTAGHTGRGGAEIWARKAPAKHQTSSVHLSKGRQDMQLDQDARHPALVLTTALCMTSSRQLRTLRALLSATLFFLLVSPLLCLSSPSVIAFSAHTHTTDTHTVSADATDLITRTIHPPSYNARTDFYVPLHPYHHPLARPLLSIAAAAIVALAPPRLYPSRASHRLKLVARQLVPYSSLPLRIPSLISTLCA
jgi:hypothetical protein